MKVLLADDDLFSTRMLQAALAEWGYDVIVASEGETAWRILGGENAPRLAVLDWMMPGMDGLEVCRKVRARQGSDPPYLILLTSRDQKEHIVAGLESGANDYVTKPFDREELRARVNVGRQMLELQGRLGDRVRELQEALARVKQLQGLLPICAWCKKIRDDQNYWQSVEDYIGAHSEAHFTHGICPECLKKEIEAHAKKSSPLA